MKGRLEPPVLMHIRDPAELTVDAEESACLSCFPSDSALSTGEVCGSGGLDLPSAQRPELLRAAPGRCGPVLCCRLPSKCHSPPGPSPGLTACHSSRSPTAFSARSSNDLDELVMTTQVISLSPIWLLSLSSPSGRRVQSLVSPRGSLRPESC